MGISFSGWLSQLSTDLAESHSRKWAATRGAYYAYLGLWHTVTSRYPVGTNVFDRDWDALVVLDACRVDALRAVADDYDFVESVGSIRSVGSTSHEWAAKTFTTDHREAIRSTGYVTGNGYLHQAAVRDIYPPSGGTAPLGWPKWDVVDADEFAYVDQVWQDGRDERVRTVPPRRMTDRAIEAGRTQDLDRLIVHYMQPHSPYIAEAVDGERIDTDAVEFVDSIGAMRRGDLDPEVAWDRYLDNLHLVLGEVATLLDNLDAERVVITADHGELFGEYGEYGHPDGLPFSEVRRVPWVETTATDTGAYEPTVERNAVETSIEDHLRDLGYAT
jgi:hypothetical protein